MAASTRKTPFSEISHIDCTTIDFASSLRGGFVDEERFGISSKIETALVDEVKELLENDRNKKQQCDRAQCKGIIALLLQFEYDVSFCP